MKKTLSFVLAGVILGSSVTFAATKVFPDVTEEIWYKSAAESMAERGIIKGHPDGTFRPESNVTRAELAVILERLIKHMDEKNAEKVKTEEKKETKKEEGKTEEKKEEAKTTAKLTLEEAKKIAEEGDCSKEGKLKDPQENKTPYNETTKTWWFDMDVKKEGCSPACVVKDEEKTSEINWRCTGLVQ